MEVINRGVSHLRHNIMRLFLLLYYVLFDYSIDTVIVIVSLVCLLFETNSKLAFLALVRPIKLFR